MHFQITSTKWDSKLFIAGWKTGDSSFIALAPQEEGWKDTVIAYPGLITAIKLELDIKGIFVWHCHNLSHDDNEMMLSYCVGACGVDCPASMCPT